MAHFTCSSCGYGSASWYGKCPQCGEWNTFVEQKKEEKGKSKLQPAHFTPFKKITSLENQRVQTGMHEVDRVLGNGFISGEVVLVAGEPGVGKSTLLLKALSKLKTIYVSGEESGMQIRQRADRLKINLDQFVFSDDVQVESILQTIGVEKIQFDVLVIDSIQTVYSGDVASPLGSMSQIRESASLLVDFAKRKNKIVVIVGHITKEGDIAGPKTLEHLVDCVLYLEGEKISQFRILRAQKNRFGPTDEVGVFEMSQNGLLEVTAPTAFIEEDIKPAPGKAIVGVIEGSRSLFFEVQSLVVPTNLAVPRRVVAGVDFNKVQLILAVLRKNLNLPLDKFDIYVSVVGGVSLKSTAADLGIAASILSSVKSIPLPVKAVFVGELGLLGEVRKILGEDKIVKEAKRYGFSRVFSSANTKSIKDLRTIVK